MQLCSGICILYTTYVYNNNTNIIDLIYKEKKIVSSKNETLSLQDNIK